jgi:Tfp pilus assembly protein PilF
VSASGSESSYSYSYSDSGSKSGSASGTGGDSSSSYSDSGSGSKSKGGDDSSYSYSYSEDKSGVEDESYSYSYSYTPTGEKSGEEDGSYSGYSGSYSYSGYSSYSDRSGSGSRDPSYYSYDYSGYSYDYSDDRGDNVNIMRKPTRGKVGLATGKWLRLIEEDPCALTLCDFALFLTSQEDYGRAESYFRRALAADPSDVRSLSSYALFLETVKHDHEAAEKLYLVALSGSRKKKKHASMHNNYAVFAKNVRGQWSVAEHHYKMALRLNPDSCNAAGNLALWHKRVSLDLDRALFYMKMAVDRAEFVEDKEVWERRYKRLIKEIQTSEKAKERQRQRQQQA